MQQAKLGQYIKCRGDRCFLWKYPLTLIRISQWSSSAFKPLAFVAYLSSPEKFLLLVFLEQIAILGFPIPPSASIFLTRLGQIWWTVGPNYSLSGSRSWFLLFELPHPHWYIHNNRKKKKKKWRLIIYTNVIRILLLLLYFFKKNYWKLLLKFLH